MVRFLLLAIFTLISCQPVYELTDKDRKDLETYPENFLIKNGKKNIVKARKIEITDSIRKVHELDISQENNEDMYQERE